MSTPDYLKQNQDFVTALVNICKDRGHRAALRRWWSEGTRHYAYPVLGRLYALEDDRKILLAALYAEHSKDNTATHVSGGNSIGSAVLKLGGNSTQTDAFPSMERHFRRLLSANSMDALAPQLHRLIKRLERDSIPLDYAQLLSDLRQFHNNPENVKTRWATAFWQASEEPTTPAEA